MTNDEFGLNCQNTALQYRDDSVSSVNYTTFNVGSDAPKEIWRVAREE